MNQNMFKRAWLSVRRKPTRSIIIALILFAVSNLILAAIIIRSAVNESTAYAKASLGGTVSIQADMSSLRQNRNSSNSSSTSGTNNTNSTNSSSTSENSPNSVSSISSIEKGKMFARPAVSRATADEISTSDFVKDYSYSVTASADCDSLTAVDSATAFPGHGPKNNLNATENSGTFALRGVNAYAYISEVKSGQMTLTEGTYFDESSSNKIIISQDLAEANNLSVGQTLQFKNPSTAQNYPLEIVGIYDNSSNVFDANTIYLNVDTAAKFLSAETYNNGDFTVDDVKYTLLDASRAADFIAWIESNYPELAEQHLIASEDTALYDQMVGPIESVGSFAVIILWVVIVAGIIIVSLIVITDVKDRRYEMGVLLSLGATKPNIIGQIFLELALVATAVFALSSFTATALADTMGQGILESQIAAAQVESENNFGRPTTGGKILGDDSAPNASNPKSSNTHTPFNSSANAISELDINARPIDFLLLFVCGYLIIILALCAPAFNILRYQPKSILQGKE